MIHDGALRINEVAKTVYVMEEFMDGDWRRMGGTTMTLDQAKAKAKEQTLKIVNIPEKVQRPKPKVEPEPAKPKGKKKKSDD